MNHRRKSRRVGRVRTGMANLEVVMTIAVMLPISGAMLFLGTHILSKLYQAIGALVSWPFL